jgi:Flp pilus assembly protein TadG
MSHLVYWSAWIENVETPVLCAHAFTEHPSYESLRRPAGHYPAGMRRCQKPAAIWSVGRNRGAMVRESVMRVRSAGAGTDQGHAGAGVMTGRWSVAARRLARWLRRGDSGAVALEFAVISIPFFIMFLGVMEVSYDLYVQAELDNAVELAARTVQVGSAQSTAGEKSSAFVKNSVCNDLGGSLNCNLLTVAVGPIPAGKDYYSYPIATSLTQAIANAAGGVQTCSGGQMMGVVAWYDGPTFLGVLVPAFTKTWNGKLVHETQSSAGFVNEFFSGGTPC